MPNQIPFPQFICRSSHLKSEWFSRTRSSYRFSPLFQQSLELPGKLRCCYKTAPCLPTHLHRCLYSLSRSLSLALTLSQKAAVLFIFLSDPIISALHTVTFAKSELWSMQCTKDKHWESHFHKEHAWGSALGPFSTLSLMEVKYFLEKQVILSHFSPSLWLGHQGLRTTDDPLGIQDLEVPGSWQ